MYIATVVHVVFATVALVAGAMALGARKGSTAHKRRGLVFVICMIVMALPALVLSWLAGKPFDALSSVMCVYMVMTGMLSFRTIDPGHMAALMALAVICIVGYLGVELYALVTSLRTTDAPPGMGYVFTTILVLALRGDISLIPGKKPAKPILRHLWRMNFGLLIATGSFFGARPHLFPEWMQASGLLLLLTFIPILVMIYYFATSRLPASWKPSFFK